jgi:hypothetical protein
MADEFKVGPWLLMHHPLRFFALSVVHVKKNLVFEAI